MQNWPALSASHGGKRQSVVGGGISLVDPVTQSYGWKRDGAQLHGSSVAALRKKEKAELRGKRVSVSRNLREICERTDEKQQLYP